MSCVRFKQLSDLPTDLIGKAIARTAVADFLERYEASRRNSPWRLRRVRMKSPLPGSPSFRRSTGILAAPLRLLVLLELLSG